MKTWLITLPLVFAVGVALADDSAMAPPSPQPEAATAPETSKPVRSARRTWHKPKRLPRGDLRHCLELKGREAIIRCAESRRKN